MKQKQNTYNRIEDINRWELLLARKISKANELLEVFGISWRLEWVGRDGLGSSITDIIKIAIEQKEVGMLKWAEIAQEILDSIDVIVLEEIDAVEVSKNTVKNEVKEVFGNVSIDRLPNNSMTDLLNRLAMIAESNKTRIPLSDFTSLHKASLVAYYNIFEDLEKQWFNDMKWRLASTFKQQFYTLLLAIKDDKKDIARLRISWTLRILNYLKDNDLIK